MTHKTKTTIKETEEVSDRDNQPVLAYRVGQLELAMKDAALAQRESTESHKEGVKELATKMDTFGMNFTPKSDFMQHQLEVDKRLLKIEGWMTWAARIILGAVLAGVLGLVIVTKGQI
jgi:hypothetical protein